MTGMRISEVLALTQSDLHPGGLMIDESALRGRPSTTKNRKTRCVPLPPAMGVELGRWAADQSGDLIFPNRVGKMDERSSIVIDGELSKVRKLAAIPDLTCGCAVRPSRRFSDQIRQTFRGSWDMPAWI
jgi:integrase